MNRPSSPGGVEPGRSSVVSALGTLGESGPLSPEQTQFKKLISKIEAARQELSQWLTFVPTYQQRYRVEMVPILSRLREKRIAMARLFDQSISDKSRQATKGEGHRYSGRPGVGTPRRSPRCRIGGTLRPE